MAGLPQPVNEIAGTVDQARGVRSLFERRMPAAAPPARLSRQIRTPSGTAPQVGTCDQLLQHLRHPDDDDEVALLIARAQPPAAVREPGPKRPGRAHLD